jgi:hypothetical protein
MNETKLRNLVTFSLFAHPEDTPIHGNASEIDEETDRETEEWILSELDSGNVWAWCTVEVRAEYAGIVGKDFLGCCSYLSEEDFKKDVYFEDMKKEAFRNLVNQLEELESKLSPLA